MEGADPGPAVGETGSRVAGVQTTSRVAGATATPRVAGATATPRVAGAFATLGCKGTTGAQISSPQRLHTSTVKVVRV